MGKDLMAEMKARQERLAVKKSEASMQNKVDADKAKSDIHPVDPADADELRPEPTPRSKPPCITLRPRPPQATRPPLVPHTSGPTSPTSPTPSSGHSHDDSAEAAVGSLSAKGPLPAPRLKRASSEQERESGSSSAAGPLSPLEVEVSRDEGDAFAPPGAGTEPGTGGREWSSVKSSASPPAAREEDRERTLSLPTYVRPSSPADTDLSPAEELVPALAADKQYEDESGDDSPSVQHQQDV
uniref:CASP-like protein 4U1 n=1 Tax=Monopterus albus TaxID=43700 RepID=UPI0009B3B9FE|nr:CASP-like protein 4U1 [Monopterus albus]